MITIGRSMSENNTTFYTAQEINALRSAAQFYKLHAPVSFWSKPADELKYACNGAGPDRWREINRRALTQALKPYEAAFAIHDVEYEYKIGSQRASDKNLRKNMIRIWARNFGLWRWFCIAAWIERFKVIPFVFLAVTLRGGQAWKESSDEKHHAQ